MNCPPNRTDANVAATSSDASGFPAFGGVIGVGPMKPDGVRRVGLVDGSIYRLTETTPTA